MLADAFFFFRGTQFGAKQSTSLAGRALSLNSFEADALGKAHEAHQHLPREVKWCLTIPVFWPPFAGIRQASDEQCPKHRLAVGTGASIIWFMGSGSIARVILYACTGPRW